MSLSYSHFLQKKLIFLLITFKRPYNNDSDLEIDIYFTMKIWKWIFCEFQSDSFPKKTNNKESVRKIKIE